MSGDGRSVTLMPLATICKFFGGRSGHAMDIPGNQRYVPCLFEGVVGGMPTLTRAHVQFDGQRVISATEIEAGFARGILIYFQLLVDETQGQ
jgi:hypothetical protein